MKSAGVRFLVLPVSGLAVILTTRIITTNYSVENYAIFTLVASLPFLLPLSDLGIGAAVTNAAAKLPQDAIAFALILRKCRRVLWSVASLGSVAAVVVQLGLGWTAVLNLPDSSAIGWSVAVAIAIYCLSIPASLGARLLLGFRRNSEAVAIQGMTSVVTLVLICVLSGIGASYTVVLPAALVGIVITNWVCLVRGSGDPRVREAKRIVSVASGNTRGTRVSVWATALPMLTISLALPFTFQADRIILSWNAELSDVAVYSACALVFLPALSVVQLGGRSLWGDFAANRGSQQLPMLFRRSLVASSCIAGLGAAGLVAIGPIISSIATNGTVQVSRAVFLSFAALLIAQGLHMPAGMYLTDVTGLRFQAVSAILMAAVSFPLGILLAGEIGVTGPIVSTCFSCVVFQVVPCIVFANLRMRESHGE
ncbi:lipopolysaccharide biosynthesis protein [Rhodococcus jostii]|uniref:lipopolysaccharide biosynthesis protein n=1 Tax=Rhodococcus jostii TaxID=132919 RepID=UPI00115FF89F|nr:hypothetical protein [Rhodococcus jostii]